MSINENQKIELFEDFYAWLKADGLKPKTSERLHRKKIFSSLNTTFNQFDNFPLEIVSSNINLLLSSFDELIGTVSNDDILSNIFSNFCIGK